MKEWLAALEEENQLLRNKEAVELGRSSRFATPEDVVDDLGRRETDGNEESQQRYGSGEKREGQPSQKEDTDDMKSILHGTVRLMEGMQAMQTQIVDVKRHKDVEVVKSGVASLPRLPEWKADTAPDWFLTIEPAMGDVSDGSQQWWDGMLRAARSWYATHLEKTPLERVAHRPEVPRELQNSKFQRLEKRAATLLMGAIPVSMQEEVVAGKGKDITTISILSKLMLSYQPGGLTEKSAILHALGSPEEAQGLTAAVMGLRRWLRWEWFDRTPRSRWIRSIDEEGPEGQQRPGVAHPAGKEQSADRHHPHGVECHDLRAPSISRGRAGRASGQEEEG